MIELSNENFTELVGSGYVLVDFFAEWCGPCKMLHPVLEKFSNSRNVKIVKVDVDKFNSLAKSYGVMSVPTLILFKDGNLIDTKNGYLAENILSDWINEHN